MRRILIILLSIAAIAFVILQFFQPEKNSNTDTTNLIFKHEQIPADVETIITNACLDCHSNNTKSVWYDRISPVSWMINKHVTEGKKELNFSEWATLDDYDKIGALEDIRQEVEQAKMPLKSYVMMHPEAKLSEEQKKSLLAWIDKKSEELLKASEE
ncbi:MAG TPA: cytochrome C [Prolixibacteraceae bacterium]|nr:cytochrome C [Prolixibacteraceae bacterium]